MDPRDPTMLFRYIVCLFSRSKDGGTHFFKWEHGVKRRLPSNWIQVLISVTLVSSLQRGDFSVAERYTWHLEHPGNFMCTRVREAMKGRNSLRSKLSTPSSLIPKWGFYLQKEFHNWWRPTSGNLLNIGFNFAEDLLLTLFLASRWTQAVSIQFGVKLVIGILLIDVSKGIYLFVPIGPPRFVQMLRGQWRKSFQ